MYILWNRFVVVCVYIYDTCMSRDSVCVSLHMPRSTHTATLTTTHCTHTATHTATHTKVDAYMQYHPYTTCIIVCCSVLQCVAVCGSVLQCVAACCSVLQWLQCVAVCCSVCAMCCGECCSVSAARHVQWYTYSVLQCVAVSVAMIHIHYHL